jgi:hypothetical protein
MKKFRLYLPISIVLALSSSFAASYDWNTTSTVIMVEPTYIPSFVRFQLKDNTGNACTGKWLDYYGRGTESSSNTLAVYSALLTALTSGKHVNIYGTNECKIEYVHILNY